MSYDVRYAKSGRTHVAYRIIGTGPVDLVYVPGLFSHLDIDFEYAPIRRFMHQLASFSRVVTFDKRGTGLSDRTTNSVTFEERMEDITAVMSAVGSEKAVIYGESDGATMSLLFAATYPERVRGLVIYGGEAKGSWAPDYPWEATREQYNAIIESIGRDWASESMIERSATSLAPSVARDPEFLQWLAREYRSGASPSAVVELLRMNMDMDVRQVLPTIHVPTLVIHQKGDANVRVENGRYIAQQVPGAKYVELPGADHIPVANPDIARRVVSEIGEFIRTLPVTIDRNRVLATIMFMDMVNSTAKLADLGDDRWSELVESAFRQVRNDLVKFQGKEVKTMGDGLLAMFDGPTRAIRCSSAIMKSLETLGIESRVGLHTGECIVSGRDVQGLAVNIASRIVDQASGGEVLTSRTVKDLVVGAGISFAEKGSFQLKGVPGMWEIYSVVE